LEDFVRWHSPPDWTDNEASVEDSDVFDSGELLSARGQLSRRMQKEGILSVFSIMDWYLNSATTILWSISMSVEHQHLVKL